MNPLNPEAYSLSTTSMPDMMSTEITGKSTNSQKHTQHKIA